MSSRSEQERNRFKEEYRDHFRKMRDARDSMRRNRFADKSTGSFEEMDIGELMEPVDRLTDQVRHKTAEMETRLEAALESMFKEMDETQQPERTGDEPGRKPAGRELVDRYRAQRRGALYDDLEKRADSVSVEKTVGSAGRIRDGDSGERE